MMGPIVSESRPDDGVVIDRLTLAPESRNEGSEHAVPIAVVRPHGDWDDALPVVAFLHGTGGDTEGLMPSLVAIAARGYVAVGVDAPCHGRRLDPGSAAPSHGNDDERNRHPSNASAGRRRRRGWGTAPGTRASARSSGTAPRSSPRGGAGTSSARTGREAGGTKGVAEATLGRFCSTARGMRSERSGS